jgi:rhodanese-related sulfurtransferase
MRLDALITSARSKVREIAPEAIVNELADYIVVDVREPEEVLHGYLPDAVNVPRGLLERSVTEDARFADQLRPVLVYSGTGVRSLLACLTLQQLGFRNVQSLAGGISRWSAESMPVH